MALAWLPRLKIAQKLPLAMVGSALLVSAGVGAASYLIGSSTVDQMSVRQMQTVAAGRAEAFQAYLKTVEEDLINSAAAESVQVTLRDLGIGWGQFGTTNPPVDAAATLRDHYIADNPNPAGKRQLLDAPTDPSGKKWNYDFSHSKVHPNLRAQAERRGYQDLYLFDTSGNLLYSVMKNDDFGTNFATGGKYAETGLGRVFREAMKLTQRGPVAFADLAAYAPAAGAPASFLAAPVFDPRNKLIGVMAVQMPVAPINRMMQDNAHLGATGESFYVGPDRLLRSDSLFSEADDTLTTRYENPVVAEALAGNPASGVTTDYRGMRMITTATPVEFNDAKWAMVTTISEDEAYAPVTSMRDMMLLVGGVLLALAALNGFIFSFSLSRPISRLTGTMGALAEGKLDIEVKGAERSDEIGAMAQGRAGVQGERAQGPRDDRGRADRRRAPPQRAGRDDAGAAALLRRGGRRGDRRRLHAAGGDGVPGRGTERLGPQRQRAGARRSTAASAKPARCWPPSPRPT